MDILNYFAAIISEKIHKDPLSIKGLLRLAIIDEFGGMPLQMDYDDLRKVFKNSLRIRLEKINIPNTDQIMQELLAILTKKQSLFTMAQF